LVVPQIAQFAPANQHDVIHRYPPDDPSVNHGEIADR
jgi:hypothetical protein